MNSEKRLCNRVAVEIKIYCIKNGIGFLREQFLSVGRDLSLQGARIATNKEMSVGEHIVMVIEIPVYCFPLLAYGEVVWIKKEGAREAGFPDALEAGVKFYKLELVDKKRLKNFVITRGNTYCAKRFIDTPGNGKSDLVYSREGHMVRNQRIGICSIPF